MMLCTSVLCINEIKLNMLGHSLSCPGLSTLLCNLIVSADDADVASKAIGNSSGWHQVRGPMACLMEQPSIQSRSPRSPQKH